MTKVQDLTGKVFGKLTVTKRAENKNGKTAWLCRCDCGDNSIVLATNLKRGLTKSCGCIHRESTSRAHKRHGLSDSPEYKTWAGIKRRCYNPNEPQYDDYGGRGIVICERWKNSFENFLSDMGNKPSPKHSIERINNNKPYSPRNCVWADDLVQSRNRRVRKESKTGVKGVGQLKGSRKYYARIGMNGRKINLGTFETLKEAEKARKEAEQKYWGKSS